MGLPSINITFKTLAATAISRSKKGIVAMILMDAKENGVHDLTSASDTPKQLSQINKEQIELAFKGYINPPRLVIVYVMDGTTKTLDDALDYFATRQFDYLVGTPDITTADASKIASWVKSERLNDHTAKSVLPATAADSEAIVNFTTEDITVGNTVYAPSEYCARIAGLIAGTPMTISCTYAPLPEVSGVARLKKSDLDKAIDKGQFIIFHDGEKVKVGRGVNSLVTTTQDKGEVFKSIKIVEAVDMIKNDIRMTIQDHYIGKYANSYDNKCLLIMAIKGYLESLEASGIIAAGSSEVGIDIEKQENYLKSIGMDVSKMTQQEIKEANTGRKVFLKAKAGILDAIEDIDLSFGM